MNAGARRLLPILRTAWPWVLLIVLAAIGWDEIKRVDLVEVRRLLGATDPRLVLALLSVTAVSLAVAGCYDVAALGPRSLPPSAASRWGVGVVSFAWSNFLAVGPLAGPALRLWLYRPMQVDSVRARRGLAAIMASFACGLGVWCAAVSLPLPEAVDGPATRVALAFAIGAAVATVWHSGLIPGSRPAEPERRLSPFVLVGIALADWLLAWAVFHMAVDGTHGDVAAGLSLKVFFLGQLVGLASFVPGGLGSADLFWGIRLSGLAGGHDRVAAALLLYRLVYYVIPFVVATLVLAGHLVRAGRRTAVFVRSALATYAFVCGALLLASAASPALHERLRFLEGTVPVALVEISHGVSVTMGFLLLIVARGLARGYSGSRRIALALFSAGAIATFVKGLDYEEAMFLVVAAALLAVFRQAFERPGRLQPSNEYLVSTGVFAVLLFVAVGVGSFAGFPTIENVFVRFETLAQSERLARGLLLLVAVATASALWLGRRSRAQDDLPDNEGIGRAIEESRRYGRNSNAMLVATGDKAVFRADPDAPEFIAYRTAGKFLVAYADPVCRPGGERELLEAFLRHAADCDREVLLYQLTPALLPVAHDFGFSLFKLGEEATVDLTRFDLKGNKAKSWRHAINAVERQGATFAIVEGAALASRLPELRRVSDTWLADRGVTEKGFSIGRFDETYLRRFPCALVLDASGAVAAFANVLDGPRGEDLTVDLMRHVDAESEHGVSGSMDYLFLMLMLYGKQRGFTRFNLGMAPLAAVGELRWARPIERLAHRFLRFGEAWYNYQGLRRFKEKFDPDWEPRYMAYQRPWDWPVAIAATTLLISGGWRSAIAFRTKGPSS
jgi:phosphatidylglycerol lysyltransferase